MAPFFISDGTALYHGDCRSVMPTFCAGLVANIVTDPPYGQKNESYDGKGVCSFDSKVWAECFRVCQEDAALVCFASPATYHRIATAIEDGGWKVQQMWAWIYKQGMITSAYPREGHDRLAPAMTPIVFATKGKVLLSLKREGNSWERKGLRNNTAPLSDRSRSAVTEVAGGHWPKTVFSDGSPPFEYFIVPRSVRRASHPNQKPVGLLESIIEKLPSGAILDPFMGSGTTGEAAINLGRRFLGVELNEEYVSIARDRLAGLVSVVA